MTFRGLYLVSSAPVLPGQPGPQVFAAVGAGAAIWAYNYFQPVTLTHPDFDAAAVSGEPDVDSERYGYSTLQVDEGYAVALCGVPANDGQNIEFCLTNPSDNGVWLRAEVLDEEGNILSMSLA